MTAFRLLVNPASGGGAASALVGPAADLLRAAGAAVEVTTSPGIVECRALAREAADSGHVVVSVGGDGMLSSVAGAVADAGGTLGILPAGRGNDFARQLGIGGTLDDLVATLVNGTPRQVDVIDVSGGDEPRVVVGSLYAGVDSLASEFVDAAHWLPRRLQYPYASLRAIAVYRPALYRLVVDGVEHYVDAATVVVANSGYYGSGMHVAPDAAVDDGLLDVVVVGAAGKLELMRSMPKLYDGSHVTLPQVTVFRGTTVELEADGVVGYGDGERIHELPLTATVRPGALTVLGPLVAKA